MTQPLKLYWWRADSGRPNLGDELGHLLLTRLFKQNVEWASMLECDAISVGSILGWPVEQKILPRRTQPLHVLGSGFMHGFPHDVAHEGMVHHFVRGALSFGKVHPDGKVAPRLGDMGLLCADLPRPTRGTRIPYAVIPHHARVGAPKFARFVADNPGSVLVDLRTDDLDAVCATLLNARVVISQSLHGLIMADALGVPNVWYQDEALHSGGIFKFLDYFSSVGRPPQLSVSQLNVPYARLTIERNIFELAPSVCARTCESIYQGVEEFLSQRQQG